MTYFFCAYAIDETVEQKYNEETELARESACFFIKHAKGECVIGRPNNQLKKLTTCNHGKDVEECLQNTASIVCVYDEDKKILDYPAIITDWHQIDSDNFHKTLFGIFKKKPKVVYGEIIMEQGKPVLAFYDKSRLWIADYSIINPGFLTEGFFTESKGKLELSKTAKQRISNTLDLSGLQAIENKTNGTFIAKRFCWDVLHWVK